MTAQLALDLTGLPAELLRRIDDARRSEQLTDCAREVLALLVDGNRAGKEKALQISAMQTLWLMNGRRVWTDRAVKAAVKELIEDHEIAIGSSRRPGSAGYYACICDADLESTEKPLRSELLSIAKRIRTFNPRSQFARRLLGQLQIEEDGAL